MQSTHTPRDIAQTRWLSQSEADAQDFSQRKNVGSQLSPILQSAWFGKHSTQRPSAMSQYGGASRPHSSLLAHRLQKLTVGGQLTPPSTQDSPGKQG
jgi:hypothetical protein